MMETRPTAQPKTRHARTFPPEAASARRARRFVQAAAAGHGLSGEAVALCTSELMANVVQHARTPVTVSLDIGEMLRLEVADGSAIMPAMADAAEDAERGRGLVIIDALAHGWGVAATPTGKCVWVELEREEAEQIL